MLHHTSCEKKFNIQIAAAKIFTRGIISVLERDPLWGLYASMDKLGRRCPLSLSPTSKSWNILSWKGPKGPWSPAPE